MYSSAKDSKYLDSIAINTMPAKLPSRVSSVPFTPSIMKLPVEILEMIFSECDEDDDFLDARPEIRLTCRAFEPIVADMLARKWTGHLTLRLQQPSVKGLAEIRPIFASYLRSISIYAIRLDHISLSEPFGTESRNTRILKAKIMEQTGWTRRTYATKQSCLVDDIEMHNKDVAKQHKYLMAGKPLDQLTRALQSLLRYNNASVTLCTLGPKHKRSADFQKRLGDFGIATLHTIHHPSSILQMLSSAVRISGYPLKAIEVDLLSGAGLRNNIRLEDIIWERLSPVPDVSFSVYQGEFPWSEPKSIVTRILSNGTMLSMEDQSLQLDYAGESYLLFSKLYYGALYDYIRNKEFRCVYLSNLGARCDFLKSDLSLNPDSLEDLQLNEVELYQHWTNHDLLLTLLTFLFYLKTLRRLKNLVLQDIRDEHGYYLQQNRVEWIGQAEIQAGLDDLIVKAKAQFT